MQTRRRFMSAALTGLTAKAGRVVAGGFVNDSFGLGHQLRDKTLTPQIRREERPRIVIVGAGIAGLSAAWRLRKRGFTDFVLLEMEQQPGGNSRWGENEITAYPWAAHYIPVPNKSSVLVRELMEELGVLNNGEWEERYLCFSPQERLFIHGRWQDGVEPELAASAKDRHDRARFDELIGEQRATGAYTIPIDAGAKASALDGISMAEWMRRSGLSSPYLLWHVDYACRDDYGAHASDTSAWAGIHYFASREDDEHGPLTWPDGNGWVARRLAAKVRDRIRAGSPAIRIEAPDKKLLVYTADVLYRCDRVIFAAPSFLARHIVADAPPAPFTYSPWLTANLTLDRMPRESGSEPAWDNVIYQSPSLGYVVATHMGLQSRTDRSVWTYYLALADGTPSQNRRMLLERDWGYWRDYVLRDLSRAHPDIAACVTRIDVMRMGHAMVRPSPGTLFNPQRSAMARLRPPVFYANSDLSGVSIFEEAQYRGVRAADAALASL